MSIRIQVDRETEELRNLRGVPDGFRSELKDSHLAPVGKVSLYRFSFMVPGDYPKAASQTPVVLAQWHDAFDPGEPHVDRSPPLAMRFKEDRLYFTIQAGQRENPQLSRLTHHDAIVPFSMPNLPRNTWHDVAVETLWSNREEGWISIHFNGEEVVARRGPIGYDYQRGPYFKMGVYSAKSSFNESHAVHFGEYSRVSGYDKPGSRCFSETLRRVLSRN